MNLIEAIKKIKSIDQEAVLYAKRFQEEWTLDPEVKLLILKEGDRELETHLIAELFCPGFEYFLEVSIIQDWIDEMGNRELDVREIKK